MHTIEQSEQFLMRLGSSKFTVDALRFNNSSPFLETDSLTTLKQWLASLSIHIKIPVYFRQNSEMEYLSEATDK